MPTATLSSKNQITVPVEVVRALGLKAGDKLIVQLVNDHAVLMPEPQSFARYFSGRLKGVYGSTKEEIDRYIAEVRRGGYEEEKEETLRDELAKYPELKQVWNAIPADWTSSIDYTELGRKVNLEGVVLDQCLEKLKTLRAIKQLKRDDLPALPLYRRTVAI